MAASKKILTEDRIATIKEFAGKIPVLELCEKAGVGYRILQGFCKELDVSYHYLKPLDKGAKEAAAKMYAEGVQTEQIKEATGLSLNQIKFICNNYGVVRPEGYKRDLDLHPWFTENKDRIAGMTIAEIMAESGFKRHIVRYLLDSRGVKCKADNNCIDFNVSKAASILGVSRTRVTQLYRAGRLVFHADGSIERVPAATPQGRPNSISETRLKIMEANGMSRDTARYHEMKGSYDHETFMVKKSKTGPKTKARFL